MKCQHKKPSPCDKLSHYPLFAFSLQFAPFIADTFQATIRNVVLQRESSQAFIWKILGHDQDAKLIYLDPYQLSVTGERDPDIQLMNIVRKLHGDLLTGDTGSYIVELTACWTLIMLITGAYLWWPQSWRGKGIFSPRLHASGKPFWRDLHAIPAFYNLLFASFLILSGLPWSVFWGEQFAKLGQTYAWIAPSPNFHSAPSLAPTLNDDPHAQHRSEKSEPWVIQHTQVAAIEPHESTQIALVEPWLQQLPIAQFGPGIRIMYPATTDDVFTISYVPDKAEGQHTLYIHPSDGHLIDAINWTRYSAGAKVVEWGVMTHMGRQYGLVNQLAGLVVCLILVAGTIVGIYLSIKRQAPGSFAPPEVKPFDALPTWMKINFVTLAVIFPLLGISMLIVLLLNWLKCRRKHEKSSSVE
jgi:uncharacterized iron-regulated membrane protein